MSITRADVADLRAGDVVEYVGEGWPDGTVLRGPVYEEGRYLYIGGSIWLRNGVGYPSPAIGSLTVISRAPRPLYVNSDKTEPDVGDVVRDADSDRRETWQQDGHGQRDDSYHRDTWWSPSETKRHKRHELPDRLRLLVDGRTGQAVQ